MRPIKMLWFLSFTCALFGQAKSQVAPATTKEIPTLTNQNPLVVPDAFELGRRAGITEEDHTKLVKLEDRVDDIRSTISWMRGAWWAVGAAIALIVIVIKFFGSSIFVAVEHRMAKARADAAANKSS